MRPTQSPKLVGVGERDAAAEADILARTVGTSRDNPAEAAEERPEEHGARTLEFRDEAADTAEIDGCEKKDGA